MRGREGRTSGEARARVEERDGAAHRVGQPVVVAPRRAVRFDPRNVLAAAVAPLAQARPTPLKRDARAGPEEAKGGRVADGVDAQVHDLLRRPHLHVVRVLAAARDASPAVLLPRRIDQDDVKLGAQRREVKGLEVDLLVGGRRRALGDASVLRLDELLQLRVLLEPLLHVRVADKVGGAQSCVHKVLGVVVLGALEARAPASGDAIAPAHRATTHATTAHLKASTTHHAAAATTLATTALATTTALAALAAAPSVGHAPAATATATIVVAHRTWPASAHRPAHRSAAALLWPHEKV
jgi:hypothetical protein